MVRLPKINIGIKKRKNYHNFSHDVETTSDFGFCQPTVISHVNAGSSSKITTNVGVRLAPLPVPTFGRIRLKTYNSFVPINEVFEAFDYFQKGTSVQSVLGSYIPKEAPYIPLSVLRDVIVAYSLKEWSTLVDERGNLKKNWEGAPFLNFTFLTPLLRSSNWKVTRETTEEKDDVTYTVKHCIFNDYTFVPFGYSPDDEEGQTTYLARAIIQKFIELYPNGSSSLGLLSGASPFTDFFDNCPSNCVADLLLHNSTLFMLPWAAISGEFDNSFNPVRKAFDFNRANGLKSDMILNVNTLHDYDSGFEDFDIILPSDPTVIYRFSDIPFMIGANWTKRGQRLFKIFNTMGLRGFNTGKDQELAPLFAYYKAWFDIMNPGRVRQWKETPCYRLIHSFYDTGVQIDKYLLGEETSPLGEQADFWNTFTSFLVDLTECCYVLPIDHFTAATLEPLQSKETIDDVSVMISDDRDKDVSIQQGDGNDNYPHASPTSLDGMVIQTLLSLYKLANKNSVIGSRIEDYLRTKYGYTIPKSQQLQGSEMVVKIEEIFANAGTTENYLGEIGGRGSNDNGASNTIEFEADRFGFFIQFMCIVPFGDYVQGNVRSKIYKNDWYQEQYDSLFKEGLGLDEIMARSNVLFASMSTEHFGDVPVYWRDKYHFSTHNGAFALPSQRDTILPYSLDRLFDEKRLEFKEPVISSVDGTIINSSQFPVINGSTINCGEELRYIGRNADYGSYDRIFFDNTGYFDNFIVHIVQDWDYYSKENSVSKSFGTYDDEHDDSVTSISHS